MPENNRILINVEITCRICLKEKSADDLRSLLGTDLNNHLSEVAGIQLHFSPSLPTAICSNCFQDLNTAINFRKQVHNAESLLKEFVCKEESDNMTVIYKTFTVLDSGVISEDCVGNIKEIIASEVVGDDVVNEVKRAKRETVVETFLKENNHIYTITNNFVSHADEDTSARAAPLISVKDTLSQVETKEIELLDTESIKTDASNTSDNKSQQNSNITPPILKCDSCFTTFKFEHSYKKHLINHGTPLGCELCLLLFYDFDAYLLHVKKDHPQYKPFACPNCEERFSTSAAIKRHNRTHSGTIQNVLRRFTCEFCHKKFPLLSALTDHKKCHTTGSGSYECDVCHKKLSCSHSLRNHLKIHEGNKKHKCDICGSTFIHRFSLEAHKRTHTGEKPFACKLCEKKFSTSSYLKIHLRTHTAEKPYVCPFCPKKFVSRCALAAHEKAHTGDKKYQCDFCGWRTSRSADLRTHIRSHTGEKPYRCSQCGKSFKTASNLSAHKRTHLGLKEHLCSICDKAFGDPRTLKSHIRVHTGETPYQCHICGHRFKQSGQLSAHRKTHQAKAVSDNT